MTRWPLIALLLLFPFLTAGRVVISQTSGSSCCSTAPTIDGALGAVAFQTGTASPALPANTTAGDLLIMVIGTSNEAATASGWTEAPDSPVSVGAGCPAVGCVRLTILYKIAAGGDATTTNDPGDHIFAFILAITSGTFNASTPFHVTAQNTQTATDSVSISGDTTTDTNTLVLAASASDLPDASSTTQYSSAANADLGSVTELVDFARVTGVGGSLFLMSGTKATAGAFGASTVTASTSGAGIRANWSAAIQGL